MKNVEECLKLIDAAVDNSFRLAYAAEPKQDLIMYHHSLGTWVRNHCGLWEDNGCNAIKEDFENLRTSGYLFENTVNYINSTHPDDLSAVILELYHDYLNKKFNFDMLKFRTIDQ